MRDGAQCREGGCLPECCRVPQEETEFEKTPLHEAAEGGHLAVVEKLLAAGADKEAEDEVCGGGGVRGAGREKSRSSTQLSVPSWLRIAFSFPGLVNGRSMAVFSQGRIR